MVLLNTFIFRNSKRGVSPLIATVLLIAFAVSLGAVVMNWASGNIHTPNLDEGDVCDSVSVLVLDNGIDKSICVDRENNKIIIDIDNGPISIDGIRMSYLAKESNYIDSIKKIEGGILSHIEFNYDVELYGEPTNVKIVPLINDNVCSKSGEFFSVIIDCK